VNITAYLAVLATGMGSDALPWISHGAGVSSQLLALFNDNGGWVNLLRLEPGARIPLHRHRGEVHSYVLSGRRRIEPEGRLLGAGEYHFEQPGNVDAWAVEGDESLVSLFIVLGLVEYLDPEGRVIRLETTESKAEAYFRTCADAGIQPLNLYR
jgi:quercetin dioxygenase-like cupin family protein